MIYIIIFAAWIPVIVFLICIHMCQQRNNDSGPQNQEQLELRQREIAELLYDQNII